MDEFQLISHMLQPLAVGEESLGLRDDAALLAHREGHQLVVTADMLHAGVHFFPHDPPEAIARKALRVNLSDLAAMGAEPYGYFLSLGLPATTDSSWMQRFCDGLAQDQALFGIRLMGGDTTRTHGPLSLNVTALGWVPHGQALQRSGAQVEDGVFVSGAIGDAALGLRDPSSLAHARYLLPQPRLTLGLALRGLATAAMDVSDGLVQDAGHLAAASEVGLVIHAASIPLSPTVHAAIAAGVFTFEEAITGGDDYELLFTAPLSFELEKAEYSCIGRVVEGEGVSVLDANGKAMPFVTKGYQHHFKGET